MIIINKPNDGIFLFIGETLKDVFTLNSSNSAFLEAANAINSFVFSLKIIAVTYLTIWIIYEALQISMGIKEARWNVVLWDFLMKCFIIILFLNYNDFINLIKDAISDLTNYASSFLFNDNWTSWHKVQSFYDESLKLITKTLDASSWWSGEKILAGIASIICLGSVLYGCLGLIRILSVLTITNSILIIIAPLIFAFLLLKSTKQIFAQYINMLISNFLSIIFVNVFASTTIKFIVTITLNDDFNVENSNIFLTLTVCIANGVLLFTASSLALSLAQNLASVSLDSAVKSAQTNTSVAGIAQSAATSKLALASSKLPSAITNQVKQEGAYLSGRYKKAKNIINSAKNHWRKK